MKSMAGNVVAVLRFIIIFTTLFIMMIGILIISIFNFEYRQIPVSGWITSKVAKFINFLLNVKVEVDDPAIFYNHRGFLFPNHTTFLDILVALDIMPVRFLAMAPIENWPIIGTIAKSIGCVFVNRQSKESRLQARDALIKASKYPPMILYPEGGIQPPPDKISPLRYGAFEIAQDTKIPFMPCILVYDKLDLVFWTDNNTMRVAWNFCKHLTTIHVKVIPLPAVTPQPDDDPIKLAQETEQAMAAVLTAAHQKKSESDG